MSVVGIDLGNYYARIAVAQGRAIQVVVSEQGSRRTSTMVAFEENCRVVGNSAKTASIKNFANSVFYFKQMLGRKIDDPGLKEELEFAPFKIAPTKDGRVGAQVTYLSQPHTFSAETITAAFLTHLKQQAERQLNKNVKDVVISCPVWWEDVRRRALLDAANIAGLNVLRLMNDTTAVALNYGILRPLPEKEARKVLFIDVGHVDTHACVVSFVHGKLTVLGSASERNLGGLLIDKLILRSLARRIMQQYKLDVLSQSRPMLKLMKEAQRIKMVLTANSEVHWHVEYIMDGQDVNGVYTRDDLENEMKEADFYNRLRLPINAALESGGVSLSELHSVEVVGGSFRPPSVIAALEDIVATKLSKTCDAEESVARGCCLQCAMLSPMYQVRKFEVQDIHSLPIELSWGVYEPQHERMAPLAIPVEDSIVLFKTNNPVPSIKMVSFKDRTKPFQILARYADPSKLPPHVSPFIGRWVIEGMQEHSTGQPQTPKIKVRVKLNLHGTVEVLDARLLKIVEVEEEVEAPPAPAPAAAPAAEGTEKEKEKKEEPKPKEEELKPKGEEPKAGAEVPKPKEEEPKAKEEGMKPKEEAPKEEEKPKKLTRLVKKQQKVPIRVTKHLLGGLPKLLFNELCNLEQDMAFRERQVVELDHLRNDLESYILTMRSAVKSEYKDFMKSDVASKFCDECTMTEDWMWDNMTASKAEVEEKLNSLKLVGDAAVQRKWELENRPQFVHTLRSTIVKFKMFATSEDPKYAHIDAEKKKKVLKDVEEVEKWLTETLKLQRQLPNHTDPVLFCSNLSDKNETLLRTCTPIMQTPKPKPKPKEEKKEEKKDEKKAEAKAEAKKEEAAAFDVPMDTEASSAVPMDTEEAPAAVPMDTTEP